MGLGGAGNLTLALSLKGVGIRVRYHDEVTLILIFTSPCRERSALGAG